MRSNRGTASVVIPCYNLGDYLAEAFESARSQTLAPRDIIIVNDGSTDEQTLRVLEKCATKGAQVLHTPNRGASAARNTGIRASRGEYILCLDGDDLLLPTYLEKTVALLAGDPEAGIAATYIEYFGWREGVWHTGEYTPTRMLWQNCVSGGSLFRKCCWESVGGYREQLKGCQDWELWLSMVERGWKWTVVKEPLYRYRQRRGSISEYREAHRAEILREIVRLHASTYQGGVAEMLVEMDAELQQVRKKLQESERDRRAQAATLAAVRKALDPPPPAAPKEKIKIQIAAVTGAPSKPPPAQRVDPEREKREKMRQEVADGVRRVIGSTLPRGATVAVVSRGDEALLEMEGRRAWHFPRGEDGTYAGYHPADSREAIAHLERLRERGAEYLVFPSTSLWWLEHYDEFRQHLERHYRALVRQPETCLVYDVRAPIEQHTFSVVICTYKRAKLLGHAIESVFRQEYPKDHYEIIVVNNDSPDDAEEVIQQAARRSPVPFSHFLEKRNGLSFARNLGIEHSRNEYVAFLDDDAIADPHWLASFNSVIEQQHALVVGGRIEKSFDDGFVPPAWFDYQYIKHFFGVNYRDRGKKEKVFRIRLPLYLTGASICYARRLFDHFGGFDTRLGRDGKSLLAGEETYLNLILERNDIPIYYTDDAVVQHFIEPYRVTKEHIRRKAYWSGVTAAVMNPMIYGYDETFRRTRASWSELRRRVQEIRSSPGSEENFSRVCRIVFNLAFLAGFYPRYLRYRLGGTEFQAPVVTWGTEEWIAEVARWPDGEEKDRHLYQLFLAEGDVEAAAAAAERLAASLPSDSSGEARARRQELWGPLERLRYEQLRSRLRSTLHESLPGGATVAMVSRGDERLLEIEGRRAWHFPQEEDGTYAGCYPADSPEAIAHLERLRERGAEYLVFPSTSLWWLEHYEEFRQHMERHYRALIRQPETCLVYDVRRRSEDSSPGVRTVSAASAA